MSLGAVLDDAQFRGRIVARAGRVSPSARLTFVAQSHQPFESLQRTLLRDRDVQTDFYRINSLRTVLISLRRTGQLRSWARPFPNASPAFV